MEYFLFDSYFVLSCLLNVVLTIVCIFLLANGKDMRFSKGKVEAVNSEPPLENGLSTKEEEDYMGQEVRELAAQVVHDVVQMASVTAQLKSEEQNSTPKNRGCNLQRLPTIQIDTVASPPPSPVDLTPPDESTEDVVNESDIQLDLDSAEPDSENSTEELREYLKSYVEDVLSQAMVLAEKKLQFVGIPDDDEDDEEIEGQDETQTEPVQSSTEPEKEVDDSEIRTTAEKVVQEIIIKASETAAEMIENGTSGLSFPGLPSIQIDTVKSAPPSPESEEELETNQGQKKWSFKVDEDSDSEKKGESEKPALIKFDEAPEDVKEVATSFVKEIVGKAVAMAQEKSTPTVPFNFENVDLMKTSGPWYIRAREAFIRLLRIACFCTPRRTDS